VALPSQLSKVVVPSFLWPATFHSLHQPQPTVVQLLVPLLRGAGLQTRPTACATAAIMACEPLMAFHLHSCILQQLLQARLELLLHARHEGSPTQDQRC
jgi:hypothetical protein